MYELMLTTTIVSCILSIIISMVTIHSNVSKGQNYFLMLIGSIFLYSISALLETLSKDEQAIVSALKIGYIAKILIFLFGIYFVSEYYHLNERLKIFNMLLWIFNIFLIFTVFLIPGNNFFCKFRIYTDSNGLLHFAREYGIGLKLFLAEVFLIVTIAIIYILAKIISDSNKFYIKRNICILMGVSMNLVVSLVHGHFPDLRFNFYPIAFSLVEITFLVCIKKYHMFDLEQNAKEYVLDNSNEGILIVNRQNEILYYNEKIADIFPEIKTSRMLEEILSDNKEKVDIYNKCKNNFSNYEHDKNRKNSFEFKLNDKNYQLFMTGFCDKNNEMSGYFIEVDDLTKEYENMQELARLTKAANRANRSKSEFLANMSHEIRTPINAILGMDEIILREADENNIKEYAGSIKTSGNNLLNLVNDILDYSKLESGKMKLIEIVYSPKELINKIYKKVYSKYACASKFKIEISISPDIPSKLYGDVDRIEQFLIKAFTLLKENAKYERLSIELGCETNGYIVEGKEVVEIILKINQSGRMVNNQNKEFTQSARKRSNHQIDMTYGMVEFLLDILGGRENVEESKDLCVEEYRIPQTIIDKTPIGKVELVMPSKEKDKAKELIIEDKKILVVDDNMVNLKVMKGLLKRTKADVCLVKSGAECLQKVQNEKFDIIFMDHVMPDMDGIETLNNLKKLENNMSKDAPVIALTANALPGSRKYYIEAGFNNYLMKPVDVEELEKMLRKYIKLDEKA